VRARSCCCCCSPSPLWPQPNRNPTQRRDHTAFLVRLKDVFPSRQQLLTDIERAVGAEGLRLEESSYEEAAEALGRQYLRQNKVVDVAAALRQHAEAREQRRREEAAAAAAAAAVVGGAR